MTDTTVVTQHHMHLSWCETNHVLDYYEKTDFKWAIVTMQLCTSLQKGLMDNLMTVSDMSVMTASLTWSRLIKRPAISSLLTMDIWTSRSTQTLWCASHIVHPPYRYQFKFCYNLTWPFLRLIFSFQKIKKQRLSIMSSSQYSKFTKF